MASIWRVFEWIGLIVIFKTLLSNEKPLNHYMLFNIIMSTTNAIVQH